jgi:predicted molibdopterin-dependent oxidoreductase YjgC
MDEIARVAPALFGGVSTTRLDRPDGDGLQWPCPAPDHPGTATVHEHGFLRGRGKLSRLSFRPSPEMDVAGFPYALITGRVLEHYNVGSMTMRTDNARLAATDYLEIHPDDAATERIADGDLVEIESRWGATRAAARVSERVARGQLFLSFHDPATRTNVLTGPQVDPLSKCPEYKLTAVRLGRGRSLTDSTV